MVWFCSRAEPSHRQHRRSASCQGHSQPEEHPVHDHRAARPSVFHRLELHSKEQSPVDSYRFSCRHLCHCPEVPRRPVLDSHHQHLHLEGARFQQRHRGILREAPQAVHGRYAEEGFVHIEQGRKKSGKVWRLQKNSVYLQTNLRLKTKIMTDNVLFTRETFLAAMRREKKRKQEWEDKMNKKLDDLQEQIKLVNDSHLYDLA